MGNIILLVEDNPDDVALISREFEKGDLVDEVVISYDGVQALDFLFGRGFYEYRDMSIMPDLILLDINLPKISGLDVLRELRLSEQTRYLPVVAFSTSRAERDIREAYQLGVNSYIRKPVDSVKFTKAIDTIKHYWLNLNEPLDAELD